MVYDAPPAMASMGAWMVSPEEFVNVKLAWKLMRQLQETPTPHPATRNPKFETRNPKPGTRDPEPGTETRNLKPETRNPEPRTQNPKPETRTKPHTPNPNPEPQTLNAQDPLMLCMAGVAPSLDPPYTLHRPSLNPEP